jgi:hypothetical protein
MKKITRPIQKDYKMPCLYRNDIEKIIEILNEAEFKEYKIETEEYEFVNINEIPKDMNIINELYISAGYYYFSLNLNKNFANLRIAENSIKGEGLFKKVDERPNPSSTALISLKNFNL